MLTEAAYMILVAEQELIAVLAPHTPLTPSTIL
jgi:hypothetical protein